MVLRIRSELIDASTVSICDLRVHPVAFCVLWRWRGVRLRPIVIASLDLSCPTRFGFAAAIGGIPSVPIGIVGQNFEMMMTNAADELASSLRCAEFLADSPSTSTLLHHHQHQQTRVGPITTNNVNQRRLSSHGQPGVISRKRPSTVDLRLNTAQHPSVPSCHDRSIHFDERVLENLLIAEENLKSNHLYFTAVQEHIEPIHREQAVEWIYDVAKEEKCDADVFPLAVSLIDRFLSLQNIFRQDIQVLAGVCLFIASKVKAPQPMNAARVSYYTADSVKVHDVLSWELLVLAHLNWEITSPTGFDFFDHLSARLPSLQTLRPAFTSILHKIQRCHKLATLFPSIQCCLALMFAAERYADARLRADTENIIGSTFHLQMDLLRSYISMMERVVNDHGMCSTHQHSSAPTEAELLAHSPGGQCGSPSLGTPHNDSGFCSGVSSPESCGKKELECSPPKMARIA
ncbi:unnamed protein product [Cylicocyclus nassatus]|uniref:Cyclin-like domain-containing protein n=1 Tax=Cylicocyclus nassatus TaxID=53992 RepID=A0AA36HD49_CYLNA|nr:unnamed protein product [Cylicocyclus nassatus]